MPGKSVYQCLRCGEMFGWGRLLSPHLAECDVPVSIDLVFAYLGVVAEGDGCWEHSMPASPNKAWVPKITVEPKNPQPAHRIIAAVSYGSMPAGLMLCHACDNRRCLRPDHLYYGTAQENTRDAWRNGRRSMSDEQKAAMTEGRIKSPKHKERMIQHNRALGERKKGDNHWTRQSPEAMERWKNAIHPPKGVMPS